MKKLDPQNCLKHEKHIILYQQNLDRNLGNWEILPSHHPYPSSRFTGVEGRHCVCVWGGGTARNWSTYNLSQSFPHLSVSRFLARLLLSLSSLSFHLPITLQSLHPNIFPPHHFQIAQWPSFSPVPELTLSSLFTGEKIFWIYWHYKT